MGAALAVASPGARGSAGNFLGIGPGGPKAPEAQTGSAGLDALNNQNSLYTGNSGDQRAAQEALSNYAQGNGSSNDVLGSMDMGAGGNAGLNQQMQNALATGPTTGSRYATEQVGDNAILGGLYGQGGQLSQAEGKLTDLQNQGFNLTPGDQTMYGQMSGDIARQFGNQGNQATQNLASRGLSSSGAAGAAFSGLAGNQNEQLANAQQQIAQQRYQNTMGQIGQYQNFVNSMGVNAGNAINQQYGRQQSGVNTQMGGLEAAAQEANASDQTANQGNMAQFDANMKNKPQNFMDAATGAASGGMGAAGKSGGQAAAAGLFG